MNETKQRPLWSMSKGRGFTEEERQDYDAWHNAMRREFEDLCNRNHVKADKTAIMRAFWVCRRLDLYSVEELGDYLANNELKAGQIRNVGRGSIGKIYAMYGLDNPYAKSKKRDTVCVIRCQDCKYYRDGDCWHEWDNAGRMYYQSVINEPNPDDYCSRAERREE